MASALASEMTDQVVDLLKTRKAGIKEDRRALDDEEKRINRALEAMGRPAINRGRPRAALPAGPSANGGSKTKSKPAIAKRGRKGGTRAEQAVALVNKAGEKGIDASAMAKAMKIKPNYLYRVMGQLEAEKLVRKDGRTYYPVA